MWHLVSITDKAIGDLFERFLDKRDVVEMVRALTVNHRREDVIAIGARRPNKHGDVAPRYMAAVTAEQVWEWLPELWTYELERHEAAYWMVNPLRSGLERPLPTKANGFAMPYYPAKNANIVGLNCIAIDMDVGREGLPSAEDALKLIAQAVRHDEIPAPSYVALSGRGAYAFWQLRDPSGGMPLKTDVNLTRWKAILWKLIDETRRLKLEPDSNATREANWFKMPGTTDTLIVNGRETKTGGKVIYLAFTETLGGKPMLYTFDELERTLGMGEMAKAVKEICEEEVETSRPRPRLREARIDGRDGSYVHGARMGEIRALCQARMRGGETSEGMRHATLFHYFASARAYYGCKYPGEGVAVEMARRDAYELNATFRPPMSENEVEKAIRLNKAHLARKCIRASTVARALQVTPAEAEALSLWAIAPEEVRTKALEQRVEGVKTRKEAREQEAREIRRLLMLGWTDVQVARELGLVNGDGKTCRQRVRNYRNELIAEGKLSRRPVSPTTQLGLAMVR